MLQDQKNSPSVSFLRIGEKGAEGEVKGKCSWVSLSVALSN